MKKLHIFTFLFLVAGLTYSSFAQSGRKTATKTSNPPIEQSPAPLAGPPPAGPPPRAGTSQRGQAFVRFYFQVVVDYAPGTNRDFPFPEKIAQWAAERLRASPVVMSDAGSRVGRDDAIKFAKNSQKKYIVFINLAGSSSTPPARPASGDQEKTWIDFVVFAPVTGKEIFQGRVSLGMSSPGVSDRSSALRACYPGLSESDYKLLAASFESADRIMEKLELSLPPLCGN